MSEGGERKQDIQIQLRLPMSEGGEPKQDSQNKIPCLGSPPSDIGNVADFGYPV
jgi:hypothetical protein